MQRIQPDEHGATRVNGGTCSTTQRLGHCRHAAAAAAVTAGTVGEQGDMRQWWHAQHHSATWLLQTSSSSSSGSNRKGSRYHHMFLVERFVGYARYSVTDLLQDALSANSCSNSRQAKDNTQSAGQAQQHTCAIP
jgi:hypothetical protein